MVFMPVSAPENPSVLPGIARTQGHIENIIKVHESAIVYLHKLHTNPLIKMKMKMKMKMKIKRKSGIYPPNLTKR